MEAATYQGYEGGLYPGGANTMPDTHFQAGLASAALIQPINGKIGLISTGMSSATQTFSAFKALADADPSTNPSLVIVDGAQGGKGVVDWINRPDHPTSPWSTLAKRIKQAGLTPNQIQVMWMYHGEEDPADYGGPFPTDARTLASQMRQVVALAEARYPNLRQIHVADMTYIGYSSVASRAEPRYGYDTQFAVKWLIEDQIGKKWQPRSFVDWSARQWADGATPRSDGFTWLCEDVEDDGVHPSALGEAKAARAILARYLADPTTPWFRR